MALSFTDGTKTSTTSEADFFDITSDKSFALWIFLHNMAAGDQIKFKIYVKDENGSAMRLYDTIVKQQVQDYPAVFVPFVPTKQYKVSLQRIGGSDRAYTWQRIEV